MAKERLLAYLEKLHGVSKNVEKKLQSGEAGDKEIKKLSGTDFENIVYDSLLEAGFKKNEITHCAQKFPDFIIEDTEDGDKIGVEVKKTDAPKWEVIGGSIYESLKNDIKDTYVLMAKMGGDKPEVRLRKYEECIADLKVTHSPRFYLNLDLEENEGIALFPEVFKSNYQKFTPWLVYSCYVWCGNVRDIFSAGGDVFDEELHIYISAIMNRTLENSESIKQRIIEMTEEEQLKFWGIETSNVEERINNWLELVEENLRCSADLIKNNKTLSLFENDSDEKICLSVRSEFISRLRCKMKKRL